MPIDAHAALQPWALRLTANGSPERCRPGKALHHPGPATHRQRAGTCHPSTCCANPLGKPHLLRRCEWLKKRHQLLRGSRKVLDVLNLSILKCLQNDHVTANCGSCTSIRFQKKQSWKTIQSTGHPSVLHQKTVLNPGSSRWPVAFGQNACDADDTSNHKQTSMN